MRIRDWGSDVCSSDLLAWHWVAVLAAVLAPWLCWKLRRAFEQLIQRAGLDADWQPEHLAAMQCLAGTLAGTAAAAFGVLVLQLQASLVAGMVLAVGAVAAWWPWHTLAGMGARRRLHMQREFPFLLDMATLCVEAGLSLQGALQQAARSEEH